MIKILKSREYLDSAIPATLAMVVVFFIFSYIVFFNEFLVKIFAGMFSFAAIAIDIILAIMFYIMDKMENKNDKL